MNLLCEFVDAHTEQYQARSVEDLADLLTSVPPTTFCSVVMSNGSTTQLAVYDRIVADPKPHDHLSAAQLTTPLRRACIVQVLTNSGRK